MLYKIQMQTNGGSLRRGHRKVYVTDPDKIEFYKKLAEKQVLGEIKIK